MEDDDGRGMGGVRVTGRLMEGEAGPCWCMGDAFDRPTRCEAVEVEEEGWAGDGRVDGDGIWGGIGGGGVTFGLCRLGCGPG